MSTKKIVVVKKTDNINVEETPPNEVSVTGEGTAVTVQTTTKKVNVKETPKEVTVTAKGGRGPQGGEGPVGPRGPAGSIESISYTHVQNAPADVWHVQHNLGFRPSVQVFDSGGTEVEGDIHHIDNNSLTITFSSSFSGEANLS